ncbi:cytochrome P450 78A5-like [Gossypium australe]|uniref:Cytochrome P450 78A5-like n=1 Tax=Gossypium australe TaxID=47621 RepID=A0A5B6V9K7_9ROSI|nr:cytochrome P450 78A5-like [Gossypium australe]
MKLLMLAMINLSLLLCLYAVTVHHDQTPWPFALVLFSFLSFLPFFMNYWLVPGGFAWRKHHVYSPQLRGPLGWPLLGTLPLMGSLAHRKLANTASSLGATRVMAFSLGTTRVIISSHPDTAREILSGSSFSDRPIKESARLLMFERAIGFAPSGKYWSHLRRLAANHMFSPRRISCLEPLRQLVVDEMLVEINKGMEEKGFVELRGILQKGSLSNILESVFGSSLVEKGELGLMVKEGLFPSMVFGLSWGEKKVSYMLSTKVRNIVGQILKERKRCGDKISNGGNDFLSALLALPKEDQLSDSDMVAVLWEMIFRGTDTVAILLEWIMARMVLHQDIQAKVQKEIDAGIDYCHNQVQDSDLPNFPYLQAVVKEVLRMHPPGPLLSWARLATHDVHVGKHMWAITHGPSIWKDPGTFRPERFIEEDVPIMGSDLRLAPFGSGRRVCPGKALGLTIVQLWLAQFLQNFRRLPTAQHVDLSETLKLSLEMKKPLTCRVVPRTTQHIIS